MCNTHHTPRSSAVSRRDLLRYGVAGATVAALGPLGRGISTAQGDPISGLRRLIVIYAYGGYDGLNLLVPVTNQAYYDRRSDIQIAPASTLALNGTTDYAMHPEFSRMQGLFNDGDVACFRKVGYPDENLSHFTSQDIYSYGVRGDFSPLGVPESGWIARYADLHAPTPMGAAALGVGRPLDFEGGTSNPFMASTLATFDFNAGGLGANAHDHRMGAARDLLDQYAGSGNGQAAADALGQGHDLAAQIQQAVADYSSPFSGAYPTSSPGVFLRDAAILIQGGFETEVFFTGFSGWDTHTNQGAETGLQANLIDRLDTAIGVLSDDLKDMGVWNDTTILVVSEFGRRNFQNSSLGTDHGHGNTFFAIGGAVNGGLYGSDITEGDVSDNNWLPYDTDFRDIYKEAIGHLGGNPLSVFPETQPISNPVDYLS